MITLDPEFVGSLAPEPKLTTAVNGSHDIPFARLPRLERLRVQGKADETEEADADAPAADGEDDEDGTQKKKMTKEEKEKKKMRGKNKALKRYLRKQRKNVIDPRAVSVLHIRWTQGRYSLCASSRSLFGRSWRGREKRGGRRRPRPLERPWNGNLLPWIGSGGRTNE